METITPVMNADREAIILLGSPRTAVYARRIWIWTRNSRLRRQGLSLRTGIRREKQGHPDPIREKTFAGFKGQFQPCMHVAGKDSEAAANESHCETKRCNHRLVLKLIQNPTMHIDNGN